MKINKGNIFKIIVIAVLALILVSVITFIVVIRDEQKDDETLSNLTPEYFENNKNTKTESVFIRLSENGSIEKIIDVSPKGKQTVINSKDIPWDIKIKYFLDDKEAELKNIISKSGKFKMTIEIDKNKNYKYSDKFFKYFILQVSTSFDNEKLINATALNGSITEVGKQVQAIYTFMPELTEKFEIKGDITNFEMPEISISGAPISDSIPIEDTDDINLLFEASKKLSDGADQIYDEMLKSSKKSTEEIDGFEKQIKENVKSIDELVLASDKLNEGATKLNASLNGDGKKDPGIIKLIDGLLLQRKTDPELQAILGGVKKYLSSQKKFNNSVIKFTGELSENFSDFNSDDLTKTLEEYKTMSSEMPKNFKEYKDGVNEFNDNIKEMNGILTLSEKWKVFSFGGLDTKTINKVLFIMRTEPFDIEAEVSDKTYDDKKSFLQKLIDLFK